MENGLTPQNPQEVVHIEETITPGEAPKGSSKWWIVLKAIVKWLCITLPTLLWRFAQYCWRRKLKVLCVILTALVGFGIISVVRCMREPVANLSFGLNRGIDVTPNVITEIKQIGQWEFLAINDEEMVDTVRKGFFSDDELIRIYYGTLRVGIDFSQCEGDWIRVDGDSLLLDLPPVKLLDENFLDETRTKSFIETGTWSNADRQALAARAKENMKRRCLTQENMALAQQTADRQVRELLKKILEKSKKGI